MKIDLSNIHGKIVKPQEGFQESFAASTVDVVWGGGILAAGKEQSLDSQILTPNGFVKMRDIKVGSKVVTPFDGIANVTAIFPQGIKDVYEFVLSDGRKCECGLEHLWTVFTEYPKSVCSQNEIEGSITVQTKYLIENMAKGKNYYVPNAILDDKKYPFSYTRNDIATRIEYIKKVRRTECQCILVDDDKHLYITDDFIVTHNSFALVLAMAEPLMTDPDFRGLISRKALQSLKAGGGFVEKFRQIFGDYCSVKESDNPRISFPNGSFCDLTYIDDSDMGRLRERAKGWEYDVIGVDEMTEMSFECFSYIMTRNRGNSKTFTGKMFATLNPKRSHWSRKFLDWYIGYDGYIIPERNGMIRYFYIRGNTVDDVVWGNTKEEVYLKCRIDIDRKLAAVGGNYSYENMIKSFVFYQGKLSENSAMLENNPDYIGSVAASGGRMSMALLEGNFNSDPDDEDNKVISNNAARSVFEEDAKRNGVRWVTVDLADYGTDNLVALAWDGLHVIDKMVLMHTTPRENAENIKIFAQNNNVGESHIIYDGVNGRYINDYIPDAVCYMSSRGAFGMYGNQSGTIKDMCYLRLCNIINSNNMSMSQSIGESTYVHSKLKKHVTIQEEFINECAAVEFRTLPNGKKKLLPKRTMNRNLSGKRSMDLLDPIAMRMLPLANYPYGEELEMEAREFVAYDDTPEYANTDNSETVNIYDERTWA